MSLTAVGILGVLLFLAILFTGLPVSFSMFLAGIVGIAVLRSPDAAFSMAAESITATFSSFTMTVAPMFILMGVIAGYSGIGASLITTANKFIGHYRGGLASAVQVVCAVFGAVCGSMPATIATIGTMAYPEMKRLGYDDKLSTGAICAGSTLAVLIPPSLTFILYGIAATVSIGKLFAAGIGTGIVLMLIYILTVAIWCRLDPKIAPRSQKFSWRERWKTLKSGGIIEVVIVFAISIGGLFAGLFTPTEAGAVGVFGMLIVVVIAKKFDWKRMIASLKETMRMTCFIYFLIAAATLYGKFFSLSQIPMTLGNWLTGSGFSPFVIMLIITIAYWVLGFVVDIQALVLLTIPVFYPIVSSLGFDGVWFGAYTVVVVGIGGLTPPVALLTYVMHGVTKYQVELKEIFKGVMPFILAGFVMLVLLVLFPQIATFIPNLLYD